MRAEPGSRQKTSRLKGWFSFYYSRRDFRQQSELFRRQLGEGTLPSHICLCRGGAGRSMGLLLRGLRRHPCRLPPSPTFPGRAAERRQVALCPPPLWTHRYKQRAPATKRQANKILNHSVAQRVTCRNLSSRTHQSDTSARTHTAKKNKPSVLHVVCSEFI